MTSNAHADIKSFSHGHAMPSMESLFAIACSFGSSVSWLLSKIAQSPSVKKLRMALHFWVGRVDRATGAAMLLLTAIEKACLCSTVHGPRPTSFMISVPPWSVIPVAC
eukprot:2412162-Pyramimonas_sp.AAC.1